MEALDILNDLIEEARIDLACKRGWYAWYSPEVTDAESRLVTLEEVRAAIVTRMCGVIPAGKP